MNCPACAHANRPGAKFCEECAAPLPRACASCGAELRATAKFCDECGTPVRARAPADASEARSEAKPSEGQRGSAQRAEGERSQPGSEAQRGSRKIVTIVFADLVGSTALHERLDAESVRRFMESYYAAMRGAVDAHGGRVTQVMGDGVKAVFGAPRVAEDDALRAVRAGVAMQRAFGELARREARLVGETGLRVAVNTGEVVADDASEIIGDPVNVAARLQEKGAVGDVVIGGETQRIVAAQVTLALLGTFALKGRSEPVKAYRVESLEPPARETSAAFVGRDDELARLTKAWDTACAKPAAQLAVLLGSPGLGKSRLIDEFARRLGEGATVMSAHCDAAGGATFAPLARALREGLGIAENASAEALRAALASVLPELPEGDAPAPPPGAPADPAEAARRAAAQEAARIARGITALLSGSPAPPEETFFVVRRLLAALAATKPVLLVIDDLHWAEPLLLDLVEHLVQWGSGTKLFVLVGARPELRDARSSLATPGGLVADVITLAGLDAFAATRLAANVIGAADLPTAIAAKLLTTSEGNPLFVGALVRMLVDEGALRREGERWVASADLASLEMPPTIHALLAARIERLRPEERGVLERAAVVGRHFSRSAVAALLGAREASELDARLEALRRAELIERDPGWWLGEPALRFHHVLIRDAAYRRVLKGTRAELHARLADWIEERAGESTEHDETIGWHLEQAHEHLRELGPLDARGVALGTRAAQRLAAAGRRALSRDDVSLAGSLLRRALERLAPESTERAALALDCAEALLSAGDVAPAAAVIEELGRLANDERLRAWHTCFASQLSVLREPQGLAAATNAVAAAASTLAKLGDVAGEAKAHHVHAQALQRLGRVGAAEAALDHALAAARRAEDRRRSNAVLAGAPLTVLWGPNPVTRASGRCLDVVRVLRITQGAPAVEAVALSCQGVLEALRGRTEAARRMVASARKLVEELGVTRRVLEVDVMAARIDLLEGDAAAAEKLLRGAAEGLRALGLGSDAAQALALLGRAALTQGRAADAEALSRESEALAGDDLQAAIAWRGVRAEALAQRGEHAAALALAQAAVEIASATDALLDHAGARLALARVLRAAGRSNEASAEETRAVELLDAKGATLLVERARSRATHAEIATPTHVAQSAPPNAIARRVRPNAATRIAARTEAALNSRDLAAFAALHASDFSVVDHPNGVEGGYDEMLRTIELFPEYRDVRLRNEPYATLGESLALCRYTIEARGGADGSVYAGAGEFWNEVFMLHQTDSAGRLSRLEVFRDDKLGDAIVRLYERHAESLPEGAARERAHMAARSIAALATQPDAVHRAAVIAPDIQVVDHRVLGLWNARGAEEALRHWGSWCDITEGATRDHDVLALTPDWLLVDRSSSGVEKQTGGAYDGRFLLLQGFGPDGRLARIEWFDGERSAEAQARFEALTAPAALQPLVVRRVRENSATRCIERFCAAIRARDVDALMAEMHESLDVVHHTTRATYGRREMRGTWRSILRAERSDFRYETLASLGETLALERHFLSIEGLAESDLGAFGSSEFDELVLFETRADGRLVHMEIFAGTELALALSRLYERQAESLPAGRERVRAEAIARSASVMLGQPDLAATAAVLAPAVEFTDLRTAGFGTLRGAEAVIASIDAMIQLSSDDAARVDELLALEDDALAVRWTNQGTDRATGGAFERRLCQLFKFGADGLVTHWQQFEAEHAADALARFDELTARGPTQQLEHAFANAASRAWDAVFPQFVSRDWERLRELLGPGFRLADRRKVVQLDFDRDTWIDFIRSVGDMPRVLGAQELVATRGERLALLRTRIEVASESDVGPSELAFLTVVEVDERGALAPATRFDADDLDAAYAELDARFAAGEGAHHPRAVAWAAEFRRSLAARDWEAMERLAARNEAARNHRLVGWGTLHGPTWVHTLQALVELSPDVSERVDHVRTSERALLWLSVRRGTREGGSFETPWLFVVELDAEGRETQLDVWDAEALPEALARFEELRAQPAARDPFANFASRAVEREVRAFAARDWDGVVTLFSRSIRFHDRRRMLHVETDYDGVVAQERLLFDLPTSRWTEPLIATRGERLSLHRVLFEAEVDGGGGPLASDEHLVVVEVDADGLVIANVLFDLEDLDTAYAELDARYEVGEGAAHASVLAFHRALDRSFAIRAWNAFEGLFLPDSTYRDHRLLGLGETMSDRRSFVSITKSLVDLAPDVRIRTDHVRSCERGVLNQIRQIGTHDGGEFERTFLSVFELDAHGRARRGDNFDLDQIDEALARFEELRAAPPARDPFANFATCALERGAAAISARDWAAFAALIVPDFAYDDRTAIGGFETSRDAWLTAFRAQIEMTSEPLAPRILATRGERLALVRIVWSGASGDVGPSEIEWLLIIEANEEALHTAVVSCDPRDLEAAFTALDERYAASEGGPARTLLAYLRAVARRDWDAVAALCAPDIVSIDRRSIALQETTRSAADWVDRHKVIVDVSPENRLWAEHVKHCDRALIGTFFDGRRSRHESEYEIPYLSVTELDERGRAKRQELFDLDRIDLAFARFEELKERAANASAPGFENAAARADAALFRCFNTRDWAGVEALAAPELVFDERRRMLRNTCGRAIWLEQFRLMFDQPQSRFTSELVATRGERLALNLHQFEAEVAGGGGRLEMEGVLVLHEIDGAERIVAIVLFDLADEAAAYAELDARFEAGEGATQANRTREAFARAVAARDWSALAAQCAPHFVERDLRRLTVLRTENSAAHWIANLRSVVELAPDTRLRFDHLRLAERGFLWQATWTGTQDGGVYEIPLVGVFEIDDAGKFVSADNWDVENVAAALARFEELGRSAPAAPRDPLAIPPNAATRTMDRWFAGTAAGDMDAVRAIYAESYALEDRRTLNRGVFDLDAAVENARFLSEGWRWKRTLLATAGERLALWRILFTHGEAGGASELEIVELDEVDADGRVARIVLFDPGARAVAHEEMFQRNLRLGGQGAPAAMLEMMRATNARDLAALRAVLRDDFVAEDHRHAGFGALDADAYVESVRAYQALSVDARIDALHVLAMSERAGVAVVRIFGTNLEGGAFESIYVALLLVSGGRIARAESFELNQLDAALARFEELGREAAPLARDPLVIPPNAATRAADRQWAAWDADDWPALEVLLHGVQYEDRRAWTRLSGGADLLLADLRHLREAQFTPRRRLLATAGERVAIEHMLWTQRESGDASEIEVLRVTEVDAEGRIVGVVILDPSDRGTAFDEASARFAAGEAAGTGGGVAATSAVNAAVARQEWDALRGLLTEDFQMRDFRTLGIGVLSRDGHVESMRALATLGTRPRIESLRHLAWNRHGRVSIARTTGLNEFGGEFEILAASLMLCDGDRLALLERYDLADSERALARFETLCAERERAGK